MSKQSHHFSIQEFIAAGLLLSLLFAASELPGASSGPAPKAAAGCATTAEHRLCGEAKHPV